MSVPSFPCIPIGSTRGYLPDLGLGNPNRVATGCWAVGMPGACPDRRCPCPPRTRTSYRSAAATRERAVVDKPVSLSSVGGEPDQADRAALTWVYAQRDIRTCPRAGPLLSLRHRGH